VTVAGIARLLIVNWNHLRRVLTEYPMHHNTGRPHPHPWLPTGHQIRISEPPQDVALPRQL
jgi:hypothetical protein